MNYYFYIRKNEIVGKGLCSCVDEDIQNIIIDEEMYNNSELYIWNGSDVVLNPNYDTEQAQKEAERIAKLYLTGADVERGIFKAKGLDFDDIVTMVQEQAPEKVKPLKIELKANNFYRGNPYVNVIGDMLGFTKEQLDLFFEDGDYTHLL